MHVRFPQCHYHLKKILSLANVLQAGFPQEKLFDVIPKLICNHACLYLYNPIFLYLGYILSWSLIKIFFVLPIATPKLCIVTQSRFRSNLLPHVRSYHKNWLMWRIPSCVWRMLFDSIRSWILRHGQHSDKRKTCGNRARLLQNLIRKTGYFHASHIYAFCRCWKD